jgi:lipoprotein NlpI
MRRLLIALLAAGVVVSSFCADNADLLLREALGVARTNEAAALKLCDQAVADFPTNAQPLAVRARLLDRMHRYEDAIRDLSAALKFDAKATLWQARGEMNFKAGRFKESVADFDRVIQLDPAQAPHHWQRGISLYYADRFIDGRRQFELHQSVNPNDVENAAWHFLCAARERGVTNARNSMISVGTDGRVPMQEIYALYRGTGAVDQVLSAATRRTNEARQRDALFYAHLYLGLYFDALGQTARAGEHISKAANDFGAEHYMGDVARVHFRRLNAGR